MKHKRILSVLGTVALVGSMSSCTFADCLFFSGLQGLDRRVCESLGDDFNLTGLDNLLGFFLNGVPGLSAGGIGSTGGFSPFNPLGLFGPLGTGGGIGNPGTGPGNGGGQPLGPGGGLGRP